jgi:hypothetical protein
MAFPGRCRGEAWVSLLDYGLKLATPVWAATGQRAQMGKDIRQPQIDE